MVTVLTKRAPQRGVVALCASLVLFLFYRTVQAAGVPTEPGAVSKNDANRVKKLLSDTTPTNTEQWRTLAGDYSQGTYYGESAYYAQPTYYAQATYYGQSYYQATYNLVFTKAASAKQSFSVQGTFSKGAGTFAIDHPLDPKNKILFHSFVESPDVKNVYDGSVVLDAFGGATVRMPDYFMALNKDFRYQLNPVAIAMPDLHVALEMKNGVFTIAGGVPGKRVSWQVTGIRHDPYIEANPIDTEVTKGPDALVGKGAFLDAAAKPRFFFDALVDAFNRVFNR